jgi:hypothetical protein
MAVIQGVQEKLRLPLYDSVFVRPGKQLRDVERSGVLKFFVDVQGKSKLETNMESSSSLPYSRTFEARALRVVISDLPPVLPERIRQSISHGSQSSSANESQKLCDCAAGLSKILDEEKAVRTLDVPAGFAACAAAANRTVDELSEIDRKSRLERWRAATYREVLARSLELARQAGSEIRGCVQSDEERAQAADARLERVQELRGRLQTASNSNARSSRSSFGVQTVGRHSPFSLPGTTAILTRRYAISFSPRDTSIFGCQRVLRMRFR